ncbi:MAG: bifunctional folylpolyglutamate synthase/dihydrofolate synthase [Thermomicrobiales bacterium]|nr:bifunctional folylpolyglutamate synthase/dihydrofolate synthase [Thermomicrobiales bacterium]
MNAATDGDAYHAYLRGLAALNSLIRGEPAGPDAPRDRRARAIRRLERTRRLLEALGNPQDAYRTVHVTGTSGKGSTAAAIAAVLTAAGYRAGLRTSPYLQVATEKLQIAHQLIDGHDLAATVDDVFATAERLGLSPLVYTEAWAALSYLWFARRKVDIAVIEVGAGGRFDTTNVITPEVSVITSVGLDHVVSLGPTLADIAWHKAGVIKPGRPVVIGELPAEALAVVRAKATALGATVVPAHPPAALATAMPCAFQAVNVGMALATTETLAARGFTIPAGAAAAGLAAARLPGRLERMPGSGGGVWLDGAHNADKMAALMASLRQQLSSRPVLVVGVLGSKDIAGMAVAVAGTDSAVVATEPQVLGNRALPAAEVATALRAAGFAGAIHCAPDPLRAVALAETLAQARREPVVVTGSLYLVGEVRRRWFPDDAVVTQRTPWPRRP